MNNQLLEQRSYHQKRYKPYVSFLWGYYYYEKEDYDSSLVYLNQSIEEYDSDMDVILANVLLLKGKIYDQKKMRQEAKRAYKDCIKLNNSTQAIVFAKEYLNKPYKG